jgi:hypothetical protein
MTEDPKALAAALAELEAEKARRIEQKIESGKAVRVQPIVVGAPGSIEAERSRRLAEMSGETREIIFENGTEEGEPIECIVTGVPRAERDPDVTPAPASVPPKTERQPEGVALKVHTVLGAREVSVQHSSRPEPPSESAGAQRHPIKAEVSPTLERDTGFVFLGEFSVEAGQLRVYDMRGRLLGSSPIASGDDPRPLARRILRQKSVGGTGDFWAPLPARRDSFH